MGNPDLYHKINMVINIGLQIKAVIMNFYFILDVQKNHHTYVVGAQKNRLNEMVLLYTQTIC